MTLSSLLLFAGTTVLGVFGAAHLLYTFRGHMLEPRDPQLRAALQQAHLGITRQTTVGRAVKGFNATHGLGMVALALVYGHLALAQPQGLAASPYLLGLGMAVLLAYLALARRYFFDVPFRGMLLACALYAGGWVLA